MKYQPGRSMTHRLHPLLKLGWLLWLTVAVFAFHSPFLPVVVVVCAVLLLWSSGVAPRRIPGVRAWVAVGTLLLVTHALSDREGAVIVGPLTADGLGAGVRAAGRLLAVISLSTLFVTTTEPVSLVFALVSMGLPYRWGFTLMTALRLAPVFRVEAHHVYRAQLVRGVAYDRLVFRRWWAMAKYLCFPLLVSALRSAHSLSLSMEGRAFGLHPRRTYMRQVQLGRLDTVAGVTLAVSMLVAVAYGLGYISL